MKNHEPSAELIAHEINNILMSLSLSIEMLSEHCINTDKTQHLFNKTRDSIERAADLNKQLLDITKTQHIPK